MRCRLPEKDAVRSHAPQGGRSGLPDVVGHTQVALAVTIDSGVHHHVTWGQSMRSILQAMNVPAGTVTSSPGSNRQKAREKILQAGAGFSRLILIDACKITLFVAPHAP